MGQVAYPEAKELLITADAGGSNGPKVRLWKMELQQFADETAPHSREPLSARHKQMEQDRAPYVQPHHTELARPPYGECRDGHQPHRLDDLHRWPSHTSFARSAKVQAEDQDHERLARERSPAVGPREARMELLHCDQ
jgi:hypothetical protein